MDNEKMEVVPKTVFEYSMARLERIIRRLTWVIIIIVALFAGYVFYDKYCDSQYDYADVAVDGKEGIANYMGDNSSGVINNGESSSQEEDAQEQE